MAKDGEVMSTSILDDPEHWRQRLITLGVSEAPGLCRQTGGALVLASLHCREGVGVGGWGTPSHPSAMPRLVNRSCFWDGIRDGLEQN